jgi:hypothetical protein
MHHAALHDRLRERGGEAGQAVHAGDEDVADLAVAEVITEPQKRAPSPSAAVPGGVRDSQIPSTCFSPSTPTTRTARTCPPGPGAPAAAPMPGGQLISRLAGDLADRRTAAANPALFHGCDLLELLVGVTDGRPGRDGIIRWRRCGHWLQRQ